jgi:hypothetical protein
MSLKSVGQDNSGMIHACKRYFVPKSVRKEIKVARFTETYISKLSVMYIYGA